MFSPAENIGISFLFRLQYYSSSVSQELSNTSSQASPEMQITS